VEFLKLGKGDGWKKQGMIDNSKQGEAKGGKRDKGKTADDDHDAHIVYSAAKIQSASFIFFYFLLFSLE
jgi:hypothetical protein